MDDPLVRIPGKSCPNQSRHSRNDCAIDLSDYWSLRPCCNVLVDQACTLPEYWL